MSTVNETSTHTDSRRSHADNLVALASGAGWLVVNGRTDSENMPQAVSELSAFSSVVLQYRGLSDVTYNPADTDEFKNALQAAADAYSSDCILTFAADSGILFADGRQLHRDEVSNGVNSLITLGKVAIEDEGTTVFEIKNKADAARLINQLRVHLPSVEVIDLVDIALDCGIIVDETADSPNFMSYKIGGNYYSTLCNTVAGENSGEIHSSKTDRVFKFKLEGHEASASSFSVTFDAQQNDIRSETEYASRASIFIDTLMKRVMANYNVLIVHKAALDSDAAIQNPPLHSCYGEPICRSSDDDTPTESTQSQLKVLIRYKDTVQRTSFTANVIDDIFITFDEDGNPHWGFSKITPGQSEPTPYAIKFGDSIEEQERGKKERDNVKEVKKLSEQRDVKYTIFEELRRNSNSNLYKLIKQREEIYRSSAASSKDIPKVEFSLTPLTIYSNHIVSRTLRYEITGTNNPNVSTVYEFKFDPLSPLASKHSVLHDGTAYTLTDTNKLVVMLESGDPAKGNAKYVSGCEDIAVNLSKVNPTHYPAKDYGDVFYLKSKCVKASATGYKGLSDGVLFYADDLEPSALSASGAMFLRREMEEVSVGAKCFVDGRPDPITVSVSGNYVPKGCKHVCPTCDTVYYASGDTWDTIAAGYKLVNGNHCCPTCAGHVIYKGRAKQGVYPLRGGSDAKYCKDDAENPKHICVCAQCRSEGKDGFVYDSGSNSRCSVCGEVVCDDAHHRSIRGGKVVCNLCLAKSSSVNTNAFGSKGDNSYADIIWRKVRMNLLLSSRSKLKYSINGKWIRIFSMKGNDVRKVRIFATRDECLLDFRKYVFVKEKSIK